MGKGSLVKSEVENARGYAFIAFRQSFGRHLGYAWFATIHRSQMALTREQWVDQGLYMYDRMVLDIDVDNRDQLHELIGTIEKALSGSYLAAGKGRMRYPNARTGAPGSDKFAMTLDTTPPWLSHDGGSLPETNAQRIREPSDPFAKFDDWEELGFRLRRLWPVLSPVERRHVGALLDDPEASMAEIAGRFGNIRQNADLTFSRIRAKAARVEAKA